MNIDERLEFLVKSQESLGRNIKELHERMNEQGERINALATMVDKHERQMERFRRALRAGLAEWLEGENGNEGE